MAAGPAPAVPGPLDALETDLRREAARIVADWRQGPASGRPALEESLYKIYEGLHDIRNHAAFGELWDRWTFQGEALEVLYPASGAHLAPLEFVHRGHLREATFTYTEIDPAMLPRLEANLQRLMNLGYYSDLAAAIVPLPPRPGERSLPPPRGDDPAAVQAWIRQSIEATGTAPPLEATFAFRYRETRVRLRLLLKAASTSPGSTEYFRGEDLEHADLVVTHDFSYDPREHLAFLRSCVESSLAAGRRRPLAVMMEDLARYPFPLDLTPFGVKATTLLPYGHASFVHMPDGTRTATEDGPPLYEGAVILEPDLSLWRGLAPSERTALFNLVLLRDHGFDRRNVDLAGGRRIEAPALLDWHMGYGHLDIDGRDLRGRQGFLSALAVACRSTVGRLPAGPLRGWLCSSLTDFRSTLDRVASRDGGTAARTAASIALDHPFLSAPATRQQFQAAVSAVDGVAATLRADAAEALSASRELKPAGLRKAGCGPAPIPVSSPAIHEARP